MLFQNFCLSTYFITLVFLQDMQAIDQAAAFLQKASTKYHESGHPDTAGQVLIKAAK